MNTYIIETNNYCEIFTRFNDAFINYLLLSYTPVKYVKLIMRKANNKLTLLEICTTNTN